MIDEATHKVLRATYNPDGSELRCHQLVMLDMLSWLDDLCIRHNITYWLSSGTLLGAIRHGGYIPWDDDVDIEIPIKEFPRLCAAILKEAPAAGYALQTTATDPEFTFPFAKLRDTRTTIAEADGLDALQAFHGAYIDIFPIAPSSSRRLHRMGAKLIGTELKMRVASRRIRPLLRPIRLLLHYSVFPLMRSLSTLLPGKKGIYRHVIPSYFPAERSISECLPTRRILFERREFNAPADPDAYLTRIYGPDYSSLPASIHTHLAKDMDLSE